MGARKAGRGACANAPCAAGEGAFDAGAIAPAADGTRPRACRPSGPSDGVWWLGGLSASCAAGPSGRTSALGASTSPQDFSYTYTAGVVANAARKPAVPEPAGPAGPATESCCSGGWAAFCVAGLSGRTSAPAASAGPVDAFYNYTAGMRSNAAGPPAAPAQGAAPAMPEPSQPQPSGGCSGSSEISGVPVITATWVNQVQPCPCAQHVEELRARLQNLLERVSPCWRRRCRSGSEDY
jgi:hypothetical protein